MPNLVEPVEGFVLLDPDITKQTAFNVGKMFDKMTQENKSPFQSFLEAMIADNDKVFKMCQNPELTPAQRKALMGDLVSSTIAANIESEGPGSFFVAGCAINVKLRELLEKYTVNEKSVSQDALTKCKLTLNQVEQRDFSSKIYEILEAEVAAKKKPLRMKKPLKVTIHGGPSHPRKQFAIANKPPLNVHGNNPFKFTAIRGPFHTTVIDLEELNLQINDADKNSFKKILEVVFQQRRKILFSVLVGFTFYIVFKKRRFLKRFLNKVGKFIKPYFKMYQKISNHWFINNRVVKSVITIHRYSKLG